jgi:tRNA-binding protein
MNEIANIEDFHKLSVNVGTIIGVDFFEEAIKPAYKLKIDFGVLGIKTSSAQITDNYNSEQLIGKQIIAITNLPIKRIAGFKSECLVLGVVDSENKVVLIKPETKVENGLKIS